jgi:hypothetical protein
MLPARAQAVDTTKALLGLIVRVSPLDAPSWAEVTPRYLLYEAVGCNFSAHGSSEDM